MKFAFRRTTTLLCCASCFDATLRSVLKEAETLGMRRAVGDWVDRMDDNFIPTLGTRIDEAADRGEDFSLLWSVMEAIDVCQAPSAAEAAVDELIAEHWRQTDGVIDEEEEAFVDKHHLPSGALRPFVGERASAYGEVTRRGARALFAAMGLHSASDAVFFDLGSGAGRLVAQAWLELPPENLRGAVGVELSPSRHGAATRAWASLSAADSSLLRPANEPEFRLASFLDTDLSSATHVYVASLCMGDDLLDALWRRLQDDVPRLECIASLREFRSANYSSKAEVEMTWTRVGGDGSPVFLYRSREAQDS